MKKSLLRMIAAALAILCLMPLFGSCGESTDGEEATALSFKSAAGVEYLKTLHGKKVTIKGWMATSSPVDGSFLFLMNMPYQSCPFCKPNTQQLSNTVEVYPKKGTSFSYTTQVVQITGTLQYTQNGKPFTDQYGYEFDYKIVDAEYVIVKDSELSSDLRLWQKVAQSEIVSDIYKMFDYVNFVCNWGTYTMTFSDGEDYLYPTDALKFLETSGAQFNYGYQEGYFDGLIAAVRKVDATQLEDLVAIIEEAKTLSDRAVAALKNGEYRSVSEYTRNSDGSLVFGDGRAQYTLTDETVITANDDLYARFYSWFSGWEL